MNLTEINETLDRIDAFFGTSLRNGRFVDINVLKNWQKDLARLNIIYIDKTLQQLEQQETSKAEPFKPTLARFMAVYNKVRGKVATVDATPFKAVETDCCTSGLRYAILAGSHASSLKLLNIKKLAHQKDLADTTYNVYRLESQPCSCKGGQHINFKGHGYSWPKLQSITEHSFKDKEEAITFYNENILPKSNVELRY